MLLAQPVLNPCLERTQLNPVLACPPALAIFGAHQAYSFLVKRGHTHDFFLSHVQREASSIARELHTAIQGYRKGSSAWLDINEIPTEAGMEQVRYGGCSCGCSKGGCNQRLSLSL